MERRKSVGVLNIQLTCVLCGGYLIDATALSECLHRFCRSCIVQYLKESRLCPICDAHIPEGKENEHLRSDETMQKLVYKLVPGLYQREMAARRAFYQEHRLPMPEGDTTTTKYFSQEDSISLSLHYYTQDEDKSKISSDEGPQKLYLKCAAGVSMRHLKKLLKIKYDLGPKLDVDIIYQGHSLLDPFTLMDVAYTFDWDRESPLPLSYRVYTKQVIKVDPKPEPEPEIKPAAPQPSQTTPCCEPHHRQRQSEYLGHLNLNPRTPPNTSGSCDEKEVKKGDESDSNTSELRIVLEKDTADVSSDEEYHPKTIKRIAKRKKHENIKKTHPQKRRKSDTFAEALRRRAIEEKKRRKSLFEISSKQVHDEGEGVMLKNEALKKVFISKPDKPEVSFLKKKEDQTKKKKRKKSKHHEGEPKRRRIGEYASPSILSVDKDSLKLKVKLPVPLKHSKVTNGQHQARDEETKSEKVDKERLSHLRAVRHKPNPPKKEFNAPPSLTISKVSKHTHVGKTSLVESKPSLEIMLVNKKEECNGKSQLPDAAVLDLSEKTKVLDLSDKSKRQQEVDTTSSLDEKTVTKSTPQNILQIAENLVQNRKQPASPDIKAAEQSMTVVAMRDLQTLSEAAVNILKMAAKSQLQAPKREDKGTGLKIPIFPRERTSPMPPIPNLHEIFPRCRLRHVPARPHPLIKPNQTVRQIPDPSVVLNRQNNLLHSQQISRPDSSTSPGKSKSIIPPLQFIKNSATQDKPKLIHNYKPFVQNKSPNTVSSTSPVRLASSSPVKLSSVSAMKVPPSSPIKLTSTPPVIRRPELTKNIESVAAGLTARATALIDAK